MKTIQEYQKCCWHTYKTAIDLPEDYSYLYGNPVKVHVPVETAENGIMIVGAYPTAHFQTIKTSAGRLIRDVPVADHLSPFSSERYYDGSSIRELKSGVELEKYYLEPLSISRSQCFITDLVKVFLFKEGHSSKYAALGKVIQPSRSKFMDYARLSIDFLTQEVKLAKPKIILFLGEEVGMAVLNKSKQKVNELMVKSEEVLFNCEGTSCRSFILPHPGIVMRDATGTAKYNRSLSQSIQIVKNHLEI
jgi:uracil-DNA glycosylase